MSVSICVPFRPADSRREINWQWCEKRLRAQHPETEIVVADSGSPEFSRAQSINRAVDESHDDTLAIVDADVLFAPQQLEMAKVAVANGGLAVAFMRFLYLTREASDQIVTGPVDTWPDVQPGDLQWMTVGSVGGFIVISRRAFEKAGGFDERFTGWGFEDVAFICAVRATSGSEMRIPGELIHLWHVSEVDSNRPTYQANYELEQRYERATPDEMNALTSEWRSSGTIPSAP